LSYSAPFEIEIIFVGEGVEERESQSDKECKEVILVPGKIRQIIRVKNCTKSSLYYLHGIYGFAALDFIEELAVVPDRPELKVKKDYYPDIIFEDPIPIDPDSFLEFYTDVIVKELEIKTPIRLKFTVEYSSVIQIPGTKPRRRIAKVKGHCIVYVAGERFSAIKKALLHQLKSDGIVIRAFLEDIWKKMGR